MLRVNNPIKFAYILFLVICIIGYSIRNVFSFEFEEFSRIVTGTTMASYFFALAGFSKSQQVSMEKHFQYYSELRGWYSDFNSKAFAYKFTPERFNSIEKSMEVAKQVQKRASVLEFIWNVIGFLAFFCILVFDNIYAYCLLSESFYTMLAFTLILTLEYIEEYYNHKYNDRYKEFVDIRKEILEILNSREKREESNHA